MSRHTIPFEGIEIEYELTRKNVKYINLEPRYDNSDISDNTEGVPYIENIEYIGQV